MLLIYEKYSKIPSATQKDKIKHKKVTEFYNLNVFASFTLLYNGWTKKKGRQKNANNKRYSFNA